MLLPGMLPLRGLLAGLDLRGRSGTGTGTGAGAETASRGFEAGSSRGLGGRGFGVGGGLEDKLVR